MTLGTATPSVEYIEDGVTLVHAIPFQFFDPDELLVIRIDGTSDANEQALVLGADYTVAGGDGDVGSITKTTGGEDGATLRIQRATRRSQLLDYQPGDDFPAEEHERGLDRLEAQIQELADQAMTEEKVRDLLAKVLVAGPGISIQVNDALNTITISALEALDFPDCVMLSGDQQAWEGVGDPAGAGGLSEEDVEDIVAAMIQVTGGLTKVYDDAANTLTIDAAGVLAAAGGAGLDLEAVQDAVAAMIAVTGGLTKAYNDGAGTLTLDGTDAGGGGGGGGLSVSDESLVANNGHEILSNGLTFMWGTVDVPANASPTIFYPIAFTSFGVPVGSGGVNDTSGSATVRVVGSSLTGFTVCNNAGTAINFFWMAIGK